MFIYLLCVIKRKTNFYTTNVSNIVQECTPNKNKNSTLA